MFYFLLFFISTIVMSTTANLVFIIIWISIWLITIRFKSNTSGFEFLVFFTGALLFYPISTTFYGVYHEFPVVISFLLFIFLILYNKNALMTLRGFVAVKFIFYSWLAWSLISYWPILDIRYFGGKYEESARLFIPVGKESSMLQIFLPVFSAAIVLVMCTFTLKSKADFNRFFEMLFKSTLILLVLSLLRYIFVFDFYPQSYTSVREFGFRLTGFSIPDANGYGMLLLFPITFLSAYTMTNYKSMSMFHWITLTLGVVSIALTFSRGTYFAFLVGVVIVLVFRRSKASAFPFFMLLLLLFIAGFFFTSFFSYFGVNSDRASLENFYSRVLLWDQIFSILKVSPLFGLHPGGWVQFLLLNPEISRPMTAHNLYLGTAADWGLPMLVLALLIFYFAISNLVNSARLLPKLNTQSRFFFEWQIFGAIMWASALLIDGISEYVPHHWLFLLLGLTVALKKNVDKELTVVN